MRSSRTSKNDKKGMWNGQVLLRELRARGYRGGYTILKDWLPYNAPGPCKDPFQRLFSLL